MKSFILAAARLFVFALLGSPDAYALCTTLIKGPVAIDVKSCSVIVPETTFASKDSKYNFIRDLPPVNRKAFSDTYRGILLNGLVTNSQAIREGISTEKGALSGEVISGFVRTGAEGCKTVNGKRIEAQLTQACCDGGGAVPCLLNSSYILTNLKVSEGKVTAANGSEKRSPEAQALYAKAKAAIAAHDFKTAAALYEQLRGKAQLDVLGQYELATLYRQMDKCPSVLPLAKELNRRFETKDFWTDTDMPVRKGAFLYARCLAVLGKGSEAVLVLQGFLVEPSRYQSEIKESLSNRDLGGVRTSKEYIKYKNSAEAALRTANVNEP